MKFELEKSSPADELVTCPSIPLEESLSHCSVLLGEGVTLRCWTRLSRN